MHEALLQTMDYRVSQSTPLFPSLSSRLQPALGLLKHGSEFTYFMLETGISPSSCLYSVSYTHLTLPTILRV